MTPTLVLLAAGLARRFGGLKQLAPVTPDGAAIMDLSIADAAEAGFGRVVVVVRTSIADEVLAHLARRPVLPVVAVAQDAIEPRRERPWGTAHALLAVAAAIDGPFAVANADDYYGADAMTMLAEWLRTGCAPGRAALVGYRASSTLSAHGAVSRAVCDTGADGALRGIVEHVSIVADDTGRLASELGPIPGDPLVSMNLWGFDPSFVATVGDVWSRFLATNAASDDAELRIPDVVGDAIALGGLTVDLLGPAARWVGITYADDLAAARAQLRG